MSHSKESFTQKVASKATVTLKVQDADEIYHMLAGYQLSLLDLESQEQNEGIPSGWKPEALIKEIQDVGKCIAKLDEAIKSSQTPNR